jgi:outer membrane protein
MRLHLVIAVMLVAGVAAAAEPQFPVIQSDKPLTLDSLISLGFTYNPTLRQTALDTRLNAIGKMNAIGNFLPSVNVGMSFSQSHYLTTTYANPDGQVLSYPKPAETYTDYVVVWADTAADSSLSNPRLQKITYTTLEQPAPQGDTRSSSWYVSLSEPLFEGGQRYFLYRMAQTQEQINNLNVEDGKKSLARNIAQQVMIVLTQERLLELNKKLRDQQQDAYDLAKARFEVGAVTELDVLQAQIVLGTAENTITSTQRDLQAQREALNQLLGIDLKSSFPLEAATDVTPFQFDIGELVSQAYRNRTDLLVAGLSVERAQHNVNVYRANYLPRATLGAQWSRSEQSGTSENWTLEPRNRNSSVSLSLSWNLFDGFTREYDIKTQMVARDRSIEAERALRLSVEKDVRDAYYNLENVFNQLQITARNRELAERTLNLERERYRLGAASQLDLRDAQVTYARAETDHLQKTLEYQSSLIALELAVGRSLR